jgi:tetraacyldisaccharide 4'-kinase
MNWHPPLFWRYNGLLSWMLSPVGWIYGQIGRARLAKKKKKVSVPVICVGNLTMGGAGKTPTVIALTQACQKQGYIPHLLTRGYGGRGYQTVQVNPEHHTAPDVGDEALLLAQVAPTWVGADRYLSALAAIQAGATLLIMDDGLQNPSLHQDYKIAVFDGQIPLENTRTFPAGPFREDFQRGLNRIDHLVLINFTDAPEWRLNKPHTMAETATDFTPISPRYLAFAGIGYPEKFYNLLRKQGAHVVFSQSFPDHHAYTQQEIEALLHQAQKLQAHLITTEKDFVKIPKESQSKVQCLKIHLRVL